MNVIDKSSIKQIMGNGTFSTSILEIQSRRRDKKMSCDHKVIPKNAWVSSTRFMRCCDKQLHHILQYYVCLECGEEDFLHPKQSQVLAFCNLDTRQTSQLGKKTLEMIRVKLEMSRPSKIENLQKDMPPWMDGQYAQVKEDQYLQKRGKHALNGIGIKQDYKQKIWSNKAYSVQGWILFNFSFRRRICFLIFYIEMLDFLIINELKF